MRLEPNDVADLEPLIRCVTLTVLQELVDRHDEFGAQLGFSEREAAALLGVARHVLADARRRGEIKARKVGKEYRYSRSTLIKFLEPED